jgi:hypothetical protein
MPRWSSRVRRAASLVLGVHLLQVLLLAASAVCERGATANAMPATTRLAAGALVGHHARSHQHGGHGTAVTTPAPESLPPQHHAPTSDGACPMAMACTVTAMAAELPTIESRVVRVAAELVPHVAEAPASLHHAPEPPPPRA